MAADTAAVASLRATTAAGERRLLIYVDGQPLELSGRCLGVHEGTFA